MKRKIKLPKKFRQFLFTFGPMLLIIGLATGTVFTVKGGIDEYSPKTISDITRDRFNRVTDVRTESIEEFKLKDLKKHKFKRTSKDESGVKEVCYMLENEHLLFTYTEYKDGKISVSIEGEEKYYNLEN